MNTQTFIDFREEIPVPESGILRLSNGKYATKDQFVKEQQDKWKRKASLKIMRLEAEREVDRRKIEGLVQWLRILQLENNKLKQRKI